MRDVQHTSLGASSRKVEITSEEKDQKKKEIIDHLIVTPFRNFTLDQVSIWAVWLTVATSVFLFCTVSAVMLALR